MRAQLRMVGYVQKKDAISDKQKKGQGAGSST